MIGPAPIPANFSFSQVPMPNGDVAVVLVASRWSGTEVFFMMPAEAEVIGKELVRLGSAGNVLVSQAAPSSLVGPDGQILAPTHHEQQTTVEPFDLSGVEASVDDGESDPDEPAVHHMNRQQRRQMARQVARDLANAAK